MIDSSTEFARLLQAMTFKLYKILINHVVVYTRRCSWGFAFYYFLLTFKCDKDVQYLIVCVVASLLPSTVLLLLPFS